MGKVAAMFGTPFMPWQQHVADVAYELDERGHLAYREVILTVPRQSGKTTEILAVTTHRGLATRQFGARNKIVYTAQTRKDAREKWEEDFVEGGLKQSRELRGRFSVRLSNGSEHVRFNNGTRFGIDATTEKAGHGGTLDLGIIDEAFAQVDGRLEQAFKPAMITRPQAQLWVVSTAGWLGGSPYLWSKVERGRARAEAGAPGGVAFFEWSAPQDADPGDPETWRACMPALGYTITEAAIEAEFHSMELNDFRRAFLNHWVPKDAPAEQVIPPDLWAARVDLRSRPAVPLVFAFDVNPERSRGAIGVAGNTRKGVHIEVTDDRPGTSWMVDRIVDLDARHTPLGWVVDGRSPATSLIQALEDKGIAVTIAGPQDMARGCGELYDRATQGGLAHLGQPELLIALAGATTRPIGDAWGWARRGQTNIAPLVAITLAAHGLAVSADPSSIYESRGLVSL